MMPLPQPSTTHCVLCSGALRTTAITYQERRETQRYRYQNIPARVCTRCGEIWMDAVILQTLDRLITERDAGAQRRATQE